MTILAIESSALVASVAVLEDDVLKAEFTVNNKLTHSETLLPMLKSMMEIAGLRMKDVDAIAVSAGPGSFTGLRIGAATAKGLALAINRPIIRVSTLQAMAWGLSTVSDAVICPMMDARRGQVYCAAYRGGAVLLPEAARSLEELAEGLKQLGVQHEAGTIDAENGPAETDDRNLVLEEAPEGAREEKPEETPEAEYLLLGDGVPVYGEKMAALLTGDVSFAGAEYNRQRAAGTAVLGSIIFRKWLDRCALSMEEFREKGADGLDCFDDQVMNSDDFAPEYLRQSQAERELAEGILGDPGEHSLHKMESGLSPRHGRHTDGNAS